MDSKTNYSDRQPSKQLTAIEPGEFIEKPESDIFPANHQSFSFQVEELPQKLSQVCDKKHTGYWQHQFDRVGKTENASSWFLALSRGRVVFSGNQMLSWEKLLKILQRYVPRLQTDSAKKILLVLEEQLKSSQSVSPDTLLEKMQKLSLITQQETVEAMRLKILADFDNYLFYSSGKAQFIPQSEPAVKALTQGFDLGELIDLAIKRKLLWRQLRTYIPSMNAIPAINHEAVKNSNLTAGQKQTLQNLVRGGNTLNGIATALAKDYLEIAKVFAPMVNQGLVTLEIPSDSARQNNNLAGNPKIFIVDDSPILLKQFHSLVTSWGYRVESCQDPMLALKRIELSSPSIIFIDINMPEISGFDLVKLIRRQPTLDSVPIVILTAENKLSNKWRAQWSNCKFITKPLASEEVSKFKTELQALLSESVPLSETKLPI